MIVMIGVPKSGKSTFVKEELINQNNVVVSADRIRQLVTGHDYYGPAENFVWGVRNTMLRDLLLQETEVIIDETNTTIERRRDTIEMGLDHGYEIIGVVMNTPLKVCLNRCREDDFPKDVVIQKSEQFETPFKEEGFDDIMVINHNDNNGGGSDGIIYGDED